MKMISMKMISKEMSAGGRATAIVAPTWKPTWKVSLMGHWALCRHEEPISTTGAVQRLTALLALQGPRDRSWITGQLWPECQEQNAHGNLRSTLWRIKQQHPGLVETADTAVALGHAVSVDVDELMRHARATLEDGIALPNTLAALSTGELLPCWYEDWVLQHRERLLQIQLHALERLAVLLARDGRHLEALQAGLVAVRLDPLRESAHRVVARVHLAEGNLGEAIRQFEWCRRLLADEFGISPSRQFLDLMGPLLNPPARPASRRWPAPD
jgi:DNA-binding SARP family transcriptional activator